MKKLLLIIVLALFTVSGIKAQCPLTEAVDFTATDIHGHTWNLFEVLDAGQYVCIDFFFCTCVPCQIASPKINESYNYFGCNTGGVNYFAIDTGDDDAECLAFDETYGVEYPTISGVEGGGTAICNIYGIGAYPTVILIAPDRTIVEQDIWPIATGQTVIDALEVYGLEAHECPPPIGITEPIESIAYISSVYPNPASSTTSLVINSDEEANIIVEVFNAIGIEVMEPNSVSIEQGENNISFNVADLPNGTYFIRLRKHAEILDITRLSVVR